MGCFVPMDSRCFWVTGGDGMVGRGCQPLNWTREVDRYGAAWACGSHVVVAYL
jgi:hypothetical protein